MDTRPITAVSSYPFGFVQRNRGSVQDPRDTEIAVCVNTIQELLILKQRYFADRKPGASRINAQAMRGYGDMNVTDDAEMRRHLKDPLTQFVQQAGEADSRDSITTKCIWNYM